MPDRDVGHEQTEKILQALERRIAQVYAEARDGVKQTIEKYWAGLVERDKYMRALVRKGEITQDYYAQWLQNQIGRGERYEALQNQLAERVTNAAETAYAYINDTTPSVYSLNRNYGAYTIERATGSVGFTLWNESAVRRLLVQQPELMPYYPPQKALKRGIDLEWGKKQIRAAIQSGILQGKSIEKIANDLQRRIPDMSRKSAIRAARTAMTGAQNGGRQDSYEAAKKMGIKTKKRWIATLDGRTRDSHRRLHGEIAEIDDKFSNGLMFPGDERGRPKETYNCFIGSVKVASDSGIIRSYKHVYEGDLIAVKTAGGVEFTCTPNHPILTPRGWVSAKLLHDGDDILVTVSGKDNMPRVNPYVKHTFPSFDAIHKFFCEIGGKRTCSLSVNFHGDIPTSNVEIVSQKRFLRRRWCSGIGKSFDKILFKLSDKTFARKRSFVEHFRRVCAPSFGFMRSRCKALSFLRRRLSHSDIHGFRASADVNPVLAKNPVHDAAAKSMFSCEPLNGFSGKIFVDHVISVESSFSKCHVYNLQTQNGYYFVNSIIPQNGGKSNGIFAIAKNCRCDMVAVVEGVNDGDMMTYSEWEAMKRAERDSGGGQQRGG